MPRNLILILMIVFLVLPGLAGAQAVIGPAGNGLISARLLNGAGQAANQTAKDIKPAAKTVEGRGAMVGGIVGGAVGGPGGAAAGSYLGARIGNNAGSILDGLMSVAGKSLSFVVFAVNYMLGFIGGVAFAFGGFLLQVGLELNSRLILSPIVQVGWQMARDIANLGFVIAIIVIAFGTMLRLETYDTKKMLASLIAVALLVNFSLTFAGVFVDASNVVSDFFIKQTTPSGLGGVDIFAENLAGAFQLQKLHKVKDIASLPEFGSFGEFSASMLGLLASVFFVALFTCLGALIMLTIAALAIVRYIVLSLLLILMPLAMLTYIFPALRGNWKRWVKGFSDWLVFLPAMLFFLYLTILVVNKFGDNENLVAKVAAATEAANAGFLDRFLLTIADTLQVFTQMVVILGLMMGSLIVAKSFSLKFADGIIGVAGSGRRWLLGKMGRAAAAPLRRGSRWTGRKLLESKAAEKVVGRLSRVPGFRRAGSALANRIAASKKTTSKEVEDYREKYLKNLPTASDVHARSQLLAVPDVLRPIARAAEIAELTERGKIDEVLAGVPAAKQNETIKQWLEAAKIAGVEKKVIQIRPDWAPIIGETIEGTVPRIENVNKISKDSFKVPAVVASLTPRQLKNIQKSNLKRMIKDTAKRELDKMKQKYNLPDQLIDRFTRLSMSELKKKAARKNRTIEQEVALREQAINVLKTKKNMSDADFARLKSLANLRRIATNNPSWQVI